MEDTKQMESVVLRFECSRKSCLKDVAEIKQCALRVDKWIITTGGPVIDHILQEHPDDDSLNDSTAKLRPLTNSYGITPSLLISRGDFFERQLLQVAYVYKDEKLMLILNKIMKGADKRISLLTGIFTGNLNKKIFALSHYIYLRNEAGVDTSPPKPLFAKQIAVGQQLVALSTPFSAITLHNSWSQGTICNILDGYVALTDIKITIGCEGAPVFTLDNGNIGDLVGLMLGNLIYPNGDLVGLNFMSLPASFISSELPIFTSSQSYFLKSSFDDQGLEDRECFVQILLHNVWGSGTIISKDGLILTCSHLVKYGAIKSDLQVKVRNRLYAARVVFSTPYGHLYELAVLKITYTLLDSYPGVPICLRSSAGILDVRHLRDWDISVSEDAAILSSGTLKSKF
ncbi:uncharacterized protein isoform X2 [Rhodnius prolixus]|uniref:uncharacterized protein isoform X2 n=1 Tax=Rhodnius prolixus TaxID=13249 RepID=UPI003D18EF26